MCKTKKNYLGPRVAHSFWGRCFPCTSPECAPQRVRWGWPWPLRRPQPERRKTAGSCCNGRHASPPALWEHTHTHNIQVNPPHLHMCNLKPVGLYPESRHCGIVFPVVVRRVQSFRFSYMCIIITASNMIQRLKTQDFRSIRIMIVTKQLLQENYCLKKVNFMLGGACT